MQRKKPKTANICISEFRGFNDYFCCCCGDWWTREKQLLCGSSVFFSLENVAVTFKLSSEKIQTRLKLKNNATLYLIPRF